jgi:pimeloyl-ACP methyl ester carboxylesterase
VSDVAPHHLGGDGPPLVLLHGLTASWRIWQPIIEPLERHHAVFAPSLAGHAGGPLLEPADGGLAALADAMERTLDEAGIEQAHLVGNSLGGWLALELTRRGRARSAVLLSPAGAWRSQRDLLRVVWLIGSSSRLLARHHRTIVAMLRRPGLRRIAMRQVMEHGERVPLRAAVDIIDDAVSASAAADFLRWVRTAQPFDGAGIDGVPIRIAWAEHDRTVPFKAYGRPYVEALPDAEHVTLPGVGHVPMYDDPDLVVRTILEVTKEPSHDRIRVRGA